MNAPLSRFLVEFSLQQPIAPPETFIEPMLELEPDLEEIESEPLVTMTLEAFEQRLDDERREAAAAEQARVEAELTERFETERVAMLRDFEAARESWANEQGQQISASLTAAMAQLESELSTSLAAALQPVFAEAARTRILSELSVALASILGDPSHPPVRITGPVDLLTAFGTAHASDVSIDYVVADQAELTIVTDTTRIETRLGACLAAFQPEAPAAPPPAAPPPAVATAAAGAA